MLQQLRVFRIKIDFGGALESVEFRIQNSLKHMNKIRKALFL